MSLRALLALVGLGGVALGAPREAGARPVSHGEPPPAARNCQSVTTRTESEILTPLRSASEPELPARLLSVLPGENLCLGGPRHPGKPSFEPIELTGVGDDEGDVIPVLLHVSLVRLPDGSSVLSIQNDTDVPVQLRALKPVGASPFLVEHSYLLLAPHQRTLFSWDEPLERVALYDFQVDRPPSQQEQKLPSGPARRGTTGGLGLVGYFGVMPLRLQALSSELVDSGYSSAPSTTALGGGGLWFSIARLRLELYLFGGANTFRHRARGDDFTMNFLSGGVSLGWDVLRHRSFALYPYAGIARGTIALDDLPRSPFPLPSLRPTPDPEQGVSTSGAQLDLGVGFEQVVAPLSPSRAESFGVSVGLKLGYNVPLSNPGWTTVDPEKDIDYAGGPRSDLGGPYVLFSAGVAFRSSSL